MAHGRIVEMQTGEGKTLAATLPVALWALDGRGVHVLTFNDYLARRDAEWMGPIYRLAGPLGRLRPAGHGAADRRRAYAADITYVTAKEAGFDHLRDLCATFAGRRRAPAVPRGAGGRGRLAAHRRGARAARARGEHRCVAGARAVRRHGDAAGVGGRSVSSPALDFVVDEHGRNVGADRRRAGHGRAAPSARGSLHEAGDDLRAEPGELRAPRARALAPRRGLPGARRPHRDDRRDDRPRRAGPAVAGGPAVRARRQGGPGAAAARAR